MTEELAPCIAVVGPANAGKSNLLHQLDEKLQRRIASVLVIKGSTDGSGRYLFHSRDLRNDPEFKGRIKGHWGRFTIDRIREWIDHGRKNLELALLDFGGRHNPDNDRMLERCSHYLLVSRSGDLEGAESWEAVCQKNGLERVAWMLSVDSADQPAVLCPAPNFTAKFRWKAEPGEATNDPALDPLVDLLAGMARPKESVPYIDLRLEEDWTEAMIDDVAGRADAIREAAACGGPVIIGGGRSPAWAYLAALRCALEADPAIRVFFFDPRQPQVLVEIPAAPDGPGFPEETFAVEWSKAADGRDQLDLVIKTEDKILPPAAAQNLAGAPGFGPPPSEDVGLSGAVPLWIFGTYARWLRAAGVRKIASWDGRKKRFVAVWK